MFAGKGSHGYLCSYYEEIIKVAVRREQAMNITLWSQVTFCLVNFLLHDCGPATFLGLASEPRDPGTKAPGLVRLCQMT